MYFFEYLICFRFFWSIYLVVELLHHTVIV